MHKSRRYQDEWYCSNCGTTWQDGGGRAIDVFKRPAQTPRQQSDTPIVRTTRRSTR